MLPRILHEYINKKNCIWEKMMKNFVVMEMFMA